MKTIQKFFLILFLTGLCISADRLPAFADNAQTESMQTKAVQEKPNAKTFQDTEQKEPSFEKNGKNELQQQKAEEIPTFTWGNYFKAIGIMLLLLLIFWYVLKLVRKVGNGRFLPNQKLLPRDSMYLEGQLPLGPGKSLIVVRVLDERLVLGVTEKNINLLTKTGINHAETFEELMRQTPLKDNTDA